ncbi:MAG: hypothetical protein WC554_00580 [Clostridia bacterium]|jgi:hypothetical protein
MFKPNKVNILGKEYSIEYCDNPADVDIHKRESLWGQCDLWTRTIKVYDNGRKDGDILETIMHEVVHAIAEELKIKQITESEETVELLGIGLADTLARNGWIKQT